MIEHGGDIYSFPGVLDFSANLNPLGMPEAVRAAASEAARNAQAYPDPRCRRLAEAFSKACSVQKDQVVFGNGAEELITVLGRILPGEEVLLPVPTFEEYEASFRRGGKKIRRFYLKREKGYRLPEEVTGQITEETGIFVLCNPNNPTGVTVPQQLLLKLLARCEETGTYFVLDESFLPFVQGAQSLKNWIAHSDHLILIGSFTKIFAMAGIRLGFLLSSNEQILKALREELPCWNVSTVAQAAGVAALSEKAYLKRTIPYVRKERDFLKKGIQSAGLSAEDSEADYLFFRGPSDLRSRLLSEGILIRDCSRYPGLSDGNFRAAVRRHEENEAFLKALEHIWQKQS